MSTITDVLRMFAIPENELACISDEKSARTWTSANLDTINELVAVCDDMRSESKSKKRRRYVDSEAPEEDDDGNVVWSGDAEESEWPDTEDVVMQRLIAASKRHCLSLTGSSSKDKKRADMHFKALKRLCSEFEEMDDGALSQDASDMDCDNEEKSSTELEHDSMASAHDDYDDLDTGNHSDNEGSGSAPNAMSEHPRRFVWRIEDCPRT